MDGGGSTGAPYRRNHPGAPTMTALEHKLAGAVVVLTGSPASAGYQGMKTDFAVELMNHYPVATVNPSVTRDMMAVIFDGSRDATNGLQQATSAGLFVVSYQEVIEDMAAVPPGGEAQRH